MVASRINPHIEKYDFVKNEEEYHNLEDKHSYDIAVVQLGTTVSAPVLKDQSINSKRLAWVHSLSAGIDGYVSVPEFRDNNIPLTNAKGAFSTILGEYVALGVLSHTKNLYRFM